MNSPDSSDQPIPPEAVERAHALLALGRDLLDELGNQASEPMAEAMRLMERASADTSDLLDVNQSLVPLIAGIKRPARGGRLWAWFSGERLEREVLFDGLQHTIENLAKRGERGHAALRIQAEVLIQEDERMAQIIHLQAVDIAAAHLLLSPTQAHNCRAAGLLGGDLDRLARRTANLEAMVTASQLTRAQYRVAIQHARSVSDRFIEIRRLLLPLWKQAMGFELFSRRVAGRLDSES